MDQITAGAEQHLAAGQSQGVVQADMVEHRHQIGTHGAGEAGRVLGGRGGASCIAARVEFAPGHRDGLHGLRAARRDAHEHDLGVRVDVVERGVPGAELILRADVELGRQAR